MSRIIIVFLIGLMLISAVGGAFYAHVGFDNAISTRGEDWSHFGDYFGGVTGAILSFISILLLVYTIHLQSRQLNDAQHEMLKRDLLAHVTKADEEIMHWLERRVAVPKRVGETVEFGDIVWGLLESTYINPKEFELATGKLLRLTCLYCEALGLYRDKIDSYYIFKYHHQKAQTLINFLKQHQSCLDEQAKSFLQCCQNHLDGKSDT